MKGHLMNVTFNPEAQAGLLNVMLFTNDLRPAKEQLDERYAHGGGWSPFGADKWTIDETDGKKGLTYSSEDEEAETYPEVARATLRDETIVLFEVDWVAIIQPDGTFEVARMD